MLKASSNTDEKKVVGAKGKEAAGSREDGPAFQLTAASSLSLLAELQLKATKSHISCK